MKNKITFKARLAFGIILIILRCKAKRMADLLHYFYIKLLPDHNGSKNLNLEQGIISSFGIPVGLAIVDGCRVKSIYRIFSVK